MSILASNVKFAESLHLAYPEENLFSKRSLRKICYGLNAISKVQRQIRNSSRVHIFTDNTCSTDPSSDEVSESVSINDDMLRILQDKYCIPTSKISQKF